MDFRNARLSEDATAPGHPSLESESLIDQVHNGESHERVAGVATGSTGILHNGNQAIEHGDGETPAEGVVDEWGTLPSAQTPESVGSSQQQETGSVADAPVHALQKPHVLRTWVLVAFCLFSVALAAGLATLFSISQRENGLATVDQRYYLALEQDPGLTAPHISTASYAWTYGPTAVLTLLAVYWVQVDYQVKRMMPWYQMTKIPSDSNDSVLMDYISPFPPVALWKSLRKSHFPVLIVVTVLLLIKIMIILSTGLFAIANLSVVNTDAKLLGVGRFVPEGVGIDWVDEKAAILVNNYWTYYFFTDPMGHDGMAYPRFKPKDAINWTSYTGIVDSFMASLECENATLSVRRNRNGPIPLLTTPSCNFSNSLCNFRLTPTGHDWFSQCFRFSQCENEHEPTRNDSGWRYIISLAHVLEDYKDGSLVEDSMNLVCKPQYWLGKASITMTPESSSREDFQNFSTVQDQTDALWSTISINNFGRVVRETFDRASEVLIYIRVIPLVSPFSLFPATWSDVDWSALSHPTQAGCDLIADAFQRTHELVAAEVAKQYFMTEEEFEFTGTSTAILPRLVLRGPAFWIIESILLVCGILPLILAYRIRSLYCPLPSNSITYYAILASRSHSFTTTLSQCGLRSLDSIQKVLNGNTFIFDIQGRAIQVASTEEAGEITEDQNPTTQTAPQWYIPFALTKVSMVLLPSLSLLVLSAVEVSYQYAIRNSSIADVHEDRYTHYAWVYVTALVMAALSLSVGTLDFNVKLMGPYCDLRRSLTSALMSPAEDYLGKVAAYATISAVKTRQASVVMVSLASFVAPFLTIVVSGVYAPLAVPQEIPIELLHVNGLPSSNKSTFDIVTGPNDRDYLVSQLLLAELIVISDLDYPPWSHGVFAFPHLALSPATKTWIGGISNRSAILLDVVVPAVRGVANCTQLPHIVDDSVTRNHTVLERYLDSILPNISQPHPDPGYELPWWKSPTGHGYFGYWYADDLGNTTLTNDSEVTESAWRQMPSDYPRAVGVFGEVNNNVTTRFTAVYCKPYIERIATRVQMTLPNFTINTDFPPSPEESTAEVISHDAYTIIFNSLFGSYTSLLRENERDHSDMNIFTSQLTRSRMGKPMDQLLGPQNVQELLSTIDHLYGIYMAQVLREQLEPLPSPTFLNGTLVNPNRLRIQQDGVSTRILEGMLATIAAAMIAAFVFMRSREILPKNPCSIAAVTSLMADSELLEVVTRALRWASDGEQRPSRGIEEEEKVVFQDLSFSLGWRGPPGDRIFGIDVGQADEQE